MNETVIDPEEAVELRLLYGELLKAHQWAVAALCTDSPGLILDGVSLARLLAAEERVAVIVGRIKEIQGAS
jgi:hypothetical protein